jgi:hypothetical protein
MQRLIRRTVALPVHALLPVRRVAPALWLGGCRALAAAAPSSSPPPPRTPLPNKPKSPTASAPPPLSEPVPVGDPARDLSNAMRYCMEYVRTHDSDHYLTTLLLPSPSARSAVFAVRAFNVEMAKIPDTARREPRMGQLRYVWWRNILTDIFGHSDSAAAAAAGGSDAAAAAAAALPQGVGMSGAFRQPIALALRAVLRRHQLSRVHFERLIDSRVRLSSSSSVLRFFAGGRRV